MKTDGEIVLPKNAVVAVEIGSDWFKLVQIDRAGRAPLISRLYLQRMDELGAAPGEAIRRAVRTLDLAEGPVIACLPRQMVNLRLFELPSGDPQEIADMIDLQIAHQTPYSRDEIVFDYALAKSEREGYTRVVLAIAQSNLLRQRFRMLEEAGFTVALMTVSTEGLLAGLLAPREAGGGAVQSAVAAILDVDAGHTELAIARDGGLVFTRSIVIGARNLLEARATWEEKFVQEVGRALEAYRSEAAGGAVGRLILTGAGPRVQGLAERIQTALDVTVEMQDGLLGLPTRPGLPSLDAAPQRELSTAGLIGAGLNAAKLAINLTPESVRVRRSLAVQARHLTRMGQLIMAVVVLLSLWVVSNLYRKQAEIVALRELDARTERKANEIEAVKRKVTLVTARLASGLAPVSALTELHKLVPHEITLTSIEIASGDQVTMRGVADTVADVSKFGDALERSDLFQAVKRTRTVTGRGGKTDFEIACAVENRKP